MADEEVVKFTVDLSSRQEKAGEIEAQFINGFNPFGNLKVTLVNVSYFPFEDAVCLHYKYAMENFYQFWSREGRDAFVKALEEYNKDFQEQNLVRNKANATKNRYGSVEGYLTWQQYKISVMAKANMNVMFGYVFKEKAPFFTVTQGEALYKDRSREKEKNKKLGEIPMYLTRAQAEELAALFDRQYLRSLVPDIPDVEPRMPSVEIDYDSY